MSISPFQIMENIAAPIINETPRMTPNPVDPTVLSNNFGHPVGNITNALNIGGYVLAADSWLMEKQQTFNRSKTVERMVHPCGAGAFGYFEVTNKNLPDYCKADFLSTEGKKTPLFLRFSTVTPGKEFPDSCRNPRGFAIKFYTEQGNYDIVGLNFPVFFVRDPALGPDLIRSQQRNPANFLLNYDSLFDFSSLVPESLHATTMFFSDQGTPDGFRKMDCYGCHTFTWVNQSGNKFFVKYHFLTETGVNNLTWDQAVRMCGEDPDYAKRDLYEHLVSGGTACWKACVQLMPAEKAFAKELKWDPFDVTKVWPKDEFPLMEIGRIVLNKNPENYHRDVEQAAFHPGSLVPGIEISPDPLLQFRCFFYRDTQLYRLGTNLHQIPVNCPFRSKYLCPFSRDGAQRTDSNGFLEPHYYPNSSGNAQPGNGVFDWQSYKVDDVFVSRKPSSKHVLSLDEDLQQVRDLYNKVMSQVDREHLHFNLACCLKFCRWDIQMRTLVMLYKVDPSYARGVIQQIDLSHTIPPPSGGSIKTRPFVITFDEVESIAKQLPMISDPMNGYKLTDLSKKLIPPPVSQDTSTSSNFSSMNQLATEAKNMLGTAVSGMMTNLSA